MKRPWRKPLPIKELARVRVEPGDILVVRVDRLMPTAAFEALQQYIEDRLPDGAQCLVLDESADVRAVLATRAAQTHVEMLKGGGA